MGQKEGNSVARTGRPLIVVRRSGKRFVARCPVDAGCGRKFAGDASELALTACVQHAYAEHGWEAHSVRFG